MDASGRETLKLSGPLDLEETPKVTAQIASILARKPTVLTVDLSEVDYMDSSGLGVLIDALRKIRELGGSLELASPQAAVLKVLKITRLDQLFTIR